jgi:hypothetical protein
MLRCHSLASVTTEEWLSNSVHSSKKDSTLSVDIRAVFGTKGAGLEHKRRSESNSPSESMISSLQKHPGGQKKALISAPFKYSDLCYVPTHCITTSHHSIRPSHFECVFHLMYQKAGSTPDSWSSTKHHSINKRLH